MPNAAGMQLLVRIRNSPGARALGDARTSDNDSPRRAGLSVAQFGDVSIDRDQRDKSKTGRLEQLPKSKRRSDVIWTTGLECINGCDWVQLIDAAGTDCCRLTKSPMAESRSLLGLDVLEAISAGGRPKNVYDDRPVNHRADNVVDDVSGMIDANMLFWLTSHR